MNQTTIDLKKMWSEREGDRLSSLLVSKGDSPILISPLDEGVFKNGGRIGARFAPNAILTQFLRLSRPIKFPSISIHETIWEEQFKLILEQKRAIHLGGGHDLIYHLLLPLIGVDDLLVINLDAHLDTRTDATLHSGNPFRKFDSKIERPWHLIQVGTHPFANPLSNYGPLKNCSMKIYDRDEVGNCGKRKAIIKEITSRITEKTTLVISLDADVIKGSEMKGVSAPNHDGLAVEVIEQITRELFSVKSAATHLGIYEYNPLYDDLSALGARTLAAFMYRFLTRS